MIQVNRIYLIFNRLVTKKFLVDTSDILFNLGSTLYPKNPVPPVNNSFSIYLDSNRFLIKSWYCSRTTFFAKNSFATVNAFVPIS